MIRAVGFDLDNTLYDQRQHVFAFFAEAAAWLGGETGLEPSALEGTFQEAWNTLGPSHPKLMDTVLARHGILNPKRVQMLVRMYHHCGGSISMHLYDGVKPLLERLRGRFPLFLITDGNAAMQRRKVSKLGIGPLFSVVVLTAEKGIGMSKPHPAPFLSALEHFQFAPGECLFAGDNPECDIAGAAGVGMHTVRVLTGPFHAQAAGAVEPDFTIGCISDVERVL